MGIELFDKSGDQADGLYGEKISAPIKAKPVAQPTTGTYLTGE